MISAHCRVSERAAYTVVCGGFDDGIHWKNVMTLEDSPISQYSYPSIIQGKDGKLHAVYTWRRQRVAYKELDLSKLK